MNINYPFLKDELAMIEIRKHKWIESQKRGEEIGFATAAIDWITNYGESWKQYRLNNNSSNIFSEKRRHRRFNYQLPVQLKTEKFTVTSLTTDLNLVGVSCTVPRFIPEHTSVDVTIDFSKQSAKPQATFRFTSRVTNISALNSGAEKTYKVFIPFSETVRDYLRANTVPWAGIQI